MLQALLPKLGPAFAAVLGVGGHGIHAYHGAAVCAYVVVAAPGPATVVTVVRVPVVGVVPGDDRFQMRWRQCSDLHAGEPAVRAAGHGYFAIAPVLLGDPLDHFVTVAVFHGAILIIVRAFAGAGAPAIDAGADVAVLRPVVLHPCHRLLVVLAVRDVGEDHGPRAFPGRHVNVHRELGTVTGGRHDVLHESDAFRS